MAKYQSPGSQITRINTLFIMEPNICEFSVWNLLCVTFWCLEFWGGS
jgi:hypothetical protein